MAGRSGPVGCGRQARSVVRQAGPVRGAPGRSVVVEFSRWGAAASLSPPLLPSLPARPAACGSRLPGRSPGLPARPRPSSSAFPISPSFLSPYLLLLIFSPSSSFSSFLFIIHSPHTPLPPHSPSFPSFRIPFLLSKHSHTM